MGASVQNQVTRLGYRPLDTTAPVWLRDISRFFAIRSQFVLSGNVDDLVLMPISDVVKPITVKGALSALLETAGYNFLLTYDPFDYLQVYSPTEQTMAAARAVTGLSLNNQGGTEVAGGTFLNVIRKLVSSKDVRCALLIEHAARLTDDDSRILFGGALKLSRTAAQLSMPDGRARFNPVFWLVDKPNDLPDWLTFRNERIRSQTIKLPDLEARERATAVLVRDMRGYQETLEPKRRELVQDVARSTDGFTIASLVATIQLAEDQAYGFEQVLDAVRLYKFGVTDNLWSKPDLHQRIKTAESVLEKQVKGQHQAVAKSVNTLKRSVMGLSGAQASANPLSDRPQGVLFFAGPTGVGKTELAKAITTLLFGDERLYTRFDMSEFAQEHMEARLIGAPPGYTGYEAGGELTKAVREKPFSVLLFDEIEKAHPRILDKFLQILEDGRLTDSQGGTVYFSESIIVFTSNLGIYTERGNGERVLNVDPNMPYKEIEEKVRSEIEHFFKFKLGRPEILNRIGDNIVIFNFISETIAAQILDKQIENIAIRLKNVRGLHLDISPVVRERLLELCTENLANGGRGIGNRLETAFVNPLAQALFDGLFAPGSTVLVKELEVSDGVYSVKLA